MSASGDTRPFHTLCVDPARVRDFWPHVSALIRTAVWRGGVGRFDGIERRVLDGDAFLWIVWDGKTILSAAVTELQRSDRDLSCVVVAAGGRQMSRWLDGALAGIEAYARAEGCDAVRIFGRRGWERVLKNYRRKMVMMERAL